MDIEPILFGTIDSVSEFVDGFLDVRIDFEHALDFLNVG